MSKLLDWLIFSAFIINLGFAAFGLVGIGYSLLVPDEELCQSYVVTCHEYKLEGKCISPTHLKSIELDYHQACISNDSYVQYICGKRC